MTKECLFCNWKVRNDSHKRFNYRCGNLKSDYYNGEIPANPSFTYCIGFEEKEQTK